MPTPLRVPFHPLTSVCEVDGPLSVETPGATTVIGPFKAKVMTGATPPHSTRCDQLRSKPRAITVSDAAYDWITLCRRRGGGGIISPHLDNCSVNGGRSSVLPSKCVHRIDSGLF